MALYVGFANHFIVALPNLEIIQFVYCDPTMPMQNVSKMAGACDSVHWVTVVS